MGPAWLRTFDALEERWPWLREIPDRFEGPPTMIYAGTASYFGSGDSWSAISEGDPGATRRCHTDPVWIVEALCRAHVTSFARDEIDDVRGVSCQRYAFELELARRHAALMLPVFSGSTPPRLGGDAWIDADGRLRLADARAVGLRRSL
jgi:hypothetical protein